MKNLIILILALLPIIGFSQKPPVKIEVIPITDHIAMLKGVGGNMAVFYGEEGVFLIDDEYSQNSFGIDSAINTLTEDPVRFIINTHWHGDHTGGNTYFSEQGAVIFAHENVRKRLSEDQFMAAFGREVPSADKSAWPILTFTSDLTLHLNGEDVSIFHVHSAHTDGDAMVYFANSNVLHMGDTYFQGKFPFIDISSGGSINGLIEAIEKALFIINDKTVLIPGHGVLSNRTELSDYLAMLVDLRSQVALTMEAELPFEQIEKMELYSKYDEQWGSGFIKGPKLISFIYESLSEE